MLTLSIRSGTDAHPWAYASVPYAHAQHAHQFSYFSNVHFVYPQHARKELMRTLSMCVRNWCVHWTCASGIHAYAEHTSQELVRALSIRIRSNARTERIPFKKCWAYALGTDAYPEHTGRELMRMLIMRISSWHLCSACAPVSYAYAQHKNKNSKFERGPYKPCWAYA